MLEIISVIVLKVSVVLSVAVEIIVSLITAIYLLMVCDIIFFIGSNLSRSYWINCQQ